MTAVSQVIDTGVVVGVAVALDQHHHRCIEYITESDCSSIVPPTAWTEIRDTLPVVRNELNAEIESHRDQVVKQYSGRELTRTELVKIREDFLDTHMRSHRFLFEYYNAIVEEAPIDCSTLTTNLSNMAMEVFQDAASDYGGYQSLFEKWTRGIDDYPGIEEDLLVCEGDDEDICIEAHHIAVTRGGVIELCTVNPKHFLDHHPGEPESRKENILRVTEISELTDLSMDNYPF